MAPIAEDLARARRSALSTLRRLAGGGPVDPVLEAWRAACWQVAGFRKPSGGISLTRDEARAAGVGRSEIGALFLAHEGRLVDKWAR